MGLVSVGPVPVTIHVPAFNEGATPDSHGITTFDVSGLMAWDTARTLKEMAANPDPDARQTIGDHAGVLVDLAFAGTEQEAISGHYLLESFKIGPATYTHRKIGRVPISLSAAYVAEFA